jgi:murein peptide amidase A
MIFFAPLLLVLTLHANDLFAAEKALSLAEQCFQSLKDLTGKIDQKSLKDACAIAKQIEGCSSQEGRPIFHFDHISLHKDAKRILTFALIHGDEGPAGSVARSWMERLTKIEPRNSWRIIPILNPDGLKKRTRTNANGVDLNRNFPTKDWEADALKYWEQSAKKDPRRFPGKSPNSEIETQCAIKQIESFKPAFIISIHTPYAVLDFDGPEIKLPRFKELPWISLGNYPGSLGRYMWVDQKQPVLTVELKGKGSAEKLDAFDQLQDLSGEMAIEAQKKIQQAAPVNKKAGSN